MLRATLTALVLAVSLAGVAGAQTPPAVPTPAVPTPAVPTFDPANPPTVDAGPLLPGPTGFTETQARRWLLRAGLSNIADLELDGDGIWRGKAERQGNIVPVGLDHRGAISTQ